MHTGGVVIFHSDYIFVVCSSSYECINETSKKSHCDRVCGCVVGEDKRIVHIARPNGFSEARARQVSVCIRYLQLKSMLKTLDLAFFMVSTTTDGHDLSLYPCCA